MRPPRPDPRRTAQCDVDAGAFAAQDRLDDRAGALALSAVAILLEAVFANAAGERREAVVGDDHAAVAAAKREHGQQIDGQVGGAEVGLEGEQVARSARPPHLLAFRGQGLPRAVRGDDETRLEGALRAGIAGRSQVHAKAAGAAFDALHRPEVAGQAQRVGDMPGALAGSDAPTGVN